MNNIKFKVQYEKNLKLYSCKFFYEMKNGYCLPLVTFGKGHRQAIDLALDQYKHLVLSLV